MFAGGWVDVTADAFFGGGDLRGSAHGSGPVAHGSTPGAFTGPSSALGAFTGSGVALDGTFGSLMFAGKFFYSDRLVLYP